VLVQLTGVVSHQLRNPLGTMRTVLSLVRSNTGEPNRVAKQAWGRVERNMLRCEKIIEKSLDCMRARPLALETMSLNKWLAEVAEENDFPLDVSVKTEFEANVNARIEPERLRRCLVNGFSNACDAMLEKLPENRKAYL
jgi:signal transduction histidine kinase